MSKESLPKVFLVTNFLILLGYIALYGFGQFFINLTRLAWVGIQSNSIFSSLFNFVAGMGAVNVWVDIVIVIFFVEGRQNEIGIQCLWHANTAPNSNLFL